MAHYIRSQVVLENDGGLVEDAAVNTYTFRSTATDIEDSLDHIATFMTGFYQAVDGYLSAVLNGTGVVKSYDLTDPEPRSPLRSESFTFTPAATSIFPNEVAICLTLEGAAVSGIPVGRRRGRIFLGPLNTSSINAETPDARIDEADLQAIVDALAGTATTAQGSGLFLQVLSRTIMGAPPWTESELNAGTFTIVRISADNAYDTIRSRGAAPTLRVTNAIP